MQKFCCDGFKRWCTKLTWCRTYDGTIAHSPNIGGFLVSYCPCCGKDIRNIKVPCNELIQVIVENKIYE